MTWRTLIILSVALFLCGAYGRSVQHSRSEALSRAKQIISDPLIVSQFDDFQNFLAKGKDIHPSGSTGDMTLECALCGIAINEVFGIIQENRTIQEVESFMRTEICDRLGTDMQDVCDVLVDFVPLIAQSLNNRSDVSRVCVDVKLCSKPFAGHADPVPIPTYNINLDLPPIQRWTQICSNQSYIKTWNYAVNVVDSLLASNGTVIKELGRLLNSLIDQEYALELQGCAAAMGIDYGWVTLINIGYEVSDACTSIVAQNSDGTIMHGRNLDFWAGMGFTDALKDIALIINFQKSGKTVYKTSTLAGFAGALSGMRAGGFSVTIDTRFYPQGIIGLFTEVIAALEEKDTTLVALLTRDALAEATTWTEAMKILSTRNLTADVYYIVAGVENAEAAVISRNRTDAANIWQIDPAAGRWFEVETNYDHWEPAPWFDDRRDPANHNMNALGQSGLTLDALFKVMSTKPTLNLQTTYTFLAIPANGTYYTESRYCPYPCTQ